MKPTPRAPGAKQSTPPRAFTLVEILVSMTVGLIVMAAVASILVMSLRMVNKNREIDAAVADTRKVQEHLTAELAKAISQNSPVLNRPVFSNPSLTTPTRYATMVYRVPVGSFATVNTDAPNSQNSLIITCQPDVTPQVGDYCLMDAPNLLGKSPPAVATSTQPGIRITAVAGNANSMTLTLETTIAAGTDPSDSTTIAKTGQLVHIQREREYEVVAPAATGSTTTELHWYQSTIDVGASPPKYYVLSSHVDASAPYLFAQIPLDPSSTVYAPEPAVSWQFNFVASGADVLMEGGNKSYYQTNYAEGLIFPKSGNPLSAASYLGAGPSTMGTSTTNVSSTSSSQSSTTSSKTSSSQSSTSSSQSSTSSSKTSSSQSSTSSSKTSSSQSSTSSSKSSTSSSQSSSTSSSKSSTSSSQSSTSSSQSSTSSSKTSSSKTSSSQSSTSSSQSSTSSSKSSSTSSSQSSTSSSQSSTTSSKTTSSQTSSSQSSTSSSQSSTSSSKSSTSSSQSSTSTSQSSTSSSQTSSSQSSTSTSQSSTTSSKSSTTTTLPFDG